MPNAPSPAGHSLAARLRPLLRSRKAELSLGELAAKMDGGGGLGPVLFILTLPVLAPLPPGVSMIVALPLLVVAPQIIVGRRSLWLPNMLARRTIKRPALVKVLQRVLPILDRVETVVRPRLGVLTGRVGACVIGVTCTAIAVVLVLPIPFANLVPALALGVFSLGLTRKDGLLVLAGYGLVAAAGAVIAIGVLGFDLGIGRLRALF